MPGPIDPNSPEFDSGSDEFIALGFSAQGKLLDANKKFKKTNPQAIAQAEQRAIDRKANIARANRSLRVGAGAGTKAVQEARPTTIPNSPSVAQRRAATAAAAGVKTNTATGNVLDAVKTLGRRR